tara:strand:- start:464 stop:679 length:216 start_codon:yes stop_codon:yes gene_type:complete
MNLFDPNYWADKIARKFNLYDKADSSSVADWSRKLEGWKYWFYQIVGGLLAVLLLEVFILNPIGMSMIPWR